MPVCWQRRVMCAPDGLVDLACPRCSKIERGRPGRSTKCRFTCGGILREVTPTEREAIEARSAARREAGDRVLPNLIADGGVVLNDDR